MGREEYGKDRGMSLTKKEHTNRMAGVPIDNNKRNCPVLSGKANAERVEKKKALNPKAAKGKEVAVPRWSGKLDAAMW